MSPKALMYQGVRLVTRHKPQYVHNLGHEPKKDALHDQQPGG